jgi:hypothetical protein
VSLIVKQKLYANEARKLTVFRRAERWLELLIAVDARMLAKSILCHSRCNHRLVDNFLLLP